MLLRLPEQRVMIDTHHHAVRGECSSRSRSSDGQAVSVSIGATIKGATLAGRCGFAGHTVAKVVNDFGSAWRGETRRRSALFVASTARSLADG